jgi:hypothetical protein
MYVNINENFLTKNKAEAKKQAIADFGEDTTQLVFTDTDIGNDIIQSLEISDEKITVDVENNFGWFSVDIPIDVDLLEQLLTLTIKRMNKIRTLLESLK